MITQLSMLLTPLLAAVKLPTIVLTTVEYVVYAILAGSFVYAIVKAVIAAREKDKGTQGWDGIVAACWMPVAVFLIVGIFSVSGISEAIGLSLFE